MFQQVLAPRISKQSAHKGGNFVSPHTGRLYPSSSGDICIRHRVKRHILPAEYGSTVPEDIQLVFDSQNKIN